jgi:hypothetical protein
MSILIIISYFLALSYLPLQALAANLAIINWDDSLSLFIGVYFFIAISVSLVIGFASRKHLSFALSGIFFVFTLNFYMDFYDPYFAGIQVGEFTIGRHRFGMPIWFAIFFITSLVIYAWVKKLKNDTIGKFIFIFCLSTAASLVLQSVSGEPKLTVENTILMESPEDLHAEEIEGLVIGEPNSVYHLILDGYARNDTLKGVFDFGNDRFYRNLEERGFLTNHSTVANYSYTYLSLFSMLNYSHIDHNLPDSGVLGQKVGDSLVAKNFLRNGYTYVLYASGYETSSWSSIASKVVRCSEDNELVRLIKSRLFWSILYLKQEFADGILCQLNARKLEEEVSGIQSPIFVLNHVVSPHPPYLFDEECESQANPSLVLGNVWRDKERYISQLQCINKMVLALVDSIPGDWWIIISSDHGPASQGTEAMLDPSPELIRERLGVLLTVRPPSMRRSVENSVPNSLINVYPWLFSNLGADVGLKRDDIFFSPIGTENVRFSKIPTSAVNPSED